ncbi:MAG TPA: class I SAM-dependent methyltransferase [Crocinitomicaceae bacterium]|nr:class I SAM-dependent methyltransferase [Crocinitomicaceae bacterium]
MQEENNSCSIDSTSCCSINNDQIKINLQEHWEKSYEKDEVQLGWYQDSAKESLELITKTGISKNKKIIDIGSGSSVLIDDLIDDGYSNIIAADISQKAMDNTKNRLSETDLQKVTWIVDDLTEPTELQNLTDISIWHDRAVFHFLTEEKDRETYFELLNGAVKKGGYVIIATFNLTGANKCSRLPVQRYDEKGIAEFLGAQFNLINFFDFDYTIPNGDVRPYVYTLFRKEG